MSSENPAPSKPMGVVTYKNGHDACFDGERLDLDRVGITPYPKKMATEKRKKLAEQNYGAMNKLHTSSYLKAAGFFNSSMNFSLLKGFSTPFKKR